MSEEGKNRVPRREYHRPPLSKPGAHGLFFAKADYGAFKGYLKEAKEKYGVRLDCYVGMTNHCDPARKVGIYLLRRHSGTTNRQI